MADVEDLSSANARPTFYYAAQGAPHQRHAHEIHAVRMRNGASYAMYVRAVTMVCLYVGSACRSMSADFYLFEQCSGQQL